MTEESQFNTPSIDPAQRESIFGTIQFIVDKMVMQEIEKLMPCKVVAVDRTTNRVSVQILVSMITTAGKNTVRAQVGSIPIYSPSAGGYVINFPVAADDLGWIKATDTDISLFLQNLKQSPPNTNLIHKFDSAVFYPDNMNKTVVIAEEDADNLVIQKYDSTVRIALWEDQIKITAPTLLVRCPQVTVNCDNAEVNATADVSVTAVTAEIETSGDATITSSANVNIQAADKITLDSPEIEITGLLTASNGGAAIFSGSIAATGDVVGAGTSLHSHVHSGVQPGGGNSGPPV